MNISTTGYWSSNVVTAEFHWFSRSLADWITSYLSKDKLMPVHDLGCGPGVYLRELQAAGFTSLYGYEGDPPLDKAFPGIQRQDLTEHFSVPVPGNVLCLEVGEHIPRQYQDVLIDNIVGACSSNLILSWAVPGQIGTGHVNCLPNEYVINMMARRDFLYLDADSKEARRSASDNCWWFKNTLMVFKKRS